MDTALSRLQCDYYSEKYDNEQYFKLRKSILGETKAFSKDQQKCNEYILQKNTSISIKDINEDSSKKIAKAIASISSNLKNLWLSGLIGKSDAIIDNFLQGFILNPTLKVFTAIGCGITENGAHAISMAIKMGVSLIEMNISKNPIKDEGISCLCESLCQNPSLTYLNVSNCNITGNGAKHIASLISHEKTQIQFLDLEFNNLGDDAASDIAEGLLLNTTLKILWTQGCKMNKKEPMAKSIVYGGVPNLMFFSSFGWLDSSFRTWKRVSMPKFIRESEILCFSQDYSKGSTEPYFHFLGVCLYEIMELLIPPLLEKTK